VTADKLPSHNESGLLTVGMKITKAVERNMSVSFNVSYPVVFSVSGLNKSSAYQQLELSSFSTASPWVELVCTVQGEMPLSIESYASTYILTRTLRLPSEWINTYRAFLGID